MYIELNDVSVKYQQDVMAVSDINFTIDRGEFVFLAGHTGAGKSTIVQSFPRPARSGLAVWMLPS